MRHYRTQRRIWTSCMLLLVLLAACEAWRVEEVSPRQLVEGERVNHIRVLTADSAYVTLSNPTVRNDSIVGRPDRAVALSDVREVSVRKTTTTGWIVAGAGTGLALITIAALIALANTCFGFSC